MMPLRDDLRADQHVIAMRHHRIGKLCGRAGSQQQIADHQCRARLGEPCREFFLQALDPWTARHKRARRKAFRTQCRHRRRVAAMMADEPRRKAVLDEPRRAVRALKAMAAGAAQG